MMDADFSAAQAGEIFLSLVGASAVEGVGFLMVDSFHFKTLVKSIPSGGFVSMNNSPFGDPGTDERGGLAFRAKNGWHRITAPFTDDDYDLPFPILIAGISTIAAVFFLICWFYITSKITAIYLGNPAVTADNAAF